MYTYIRSQFLRIERSLRSFLYGKHLTRTLLSKTKYEIYRLIYTFYDSKRFIIFIFTLYEYKYFPFYKKVESNLYLLIDVQTKERYFYL